MHTFGFILEQTLGHRTHTQNLQCHIADNSSVSPLWGLVAWETSGLAAHVPVYRSNWTVRAGLQARRTIAAMNRKQPLDALFIHTQVPAVLAVDWMRRIPTVISLDATPSQYDALGEQYGHRQQAGWLEQVKWQLNRYSLTQARHLVTWSEWTKQSLIADYAIPATKITVIPPGVNVRLWPQPATRSAQREPVKILFVGGDFYRKGGAQLVRIFRRLRQAQTAAQGIELHLVTQHPFATEPGITVYNDLQPNSDRLKALFQHCDIFCLPTSGDCLPMVLAEAGATGLPLVATDVGAIREIVRDGDTGFLVQPGDEAALAVALQRLIGDAELRSHLGAQAAELIRTSHDAERNTEQLLSLLKVVADAASQQQQRHATPLNPIEEGQ
jgi:glycosyltransferase involved in cell wall biosynthesis